MSDGLHLSLVQTEGGFQQGLAVACGTASDDMGRVGEVLFQILHGPHGGLDGAALVVGVEGIQKLPLAADQRQLCGGGAGVDAQKAVAGIALQLRLGDHGLCVAGHKSVIFLLRGEEGLDPVQLKGHCDPALQLPDQGGKGDGFRVLRLQGRAHGGEKMGVFRVYHHVRRQLQGADKGLFQLRQKMERAAQKGHAASDGLTAGKAGDGLVHHRLEDGGGKVRLGGALVNERLDIRFGKHAAAGRDGVDLLIIRGFLVKPRGVGLQKGGHLVDKGAGTAGTDAVHALLQTALEIDDFGVLAAQLYGHVCLRRGKLQGGGDCHHLLHKIDPQRLAQIDGAGAGDLHLQFALTGLVQCLLQQLTQSLPGVGPVAYVFSKDDPAFFIQQYQLDCGRADINSCAI